MSQPRQQKDKPTKRKIPQISETSSDDESQIFPRVDSVPVPPPMSSSEHNISTPSNTTVTPASVQNPRRSPRKKAARVEHVPVSPSVVSSDDNTTTPLTTTFATVTPTTIKWSEEQNDAIAEFYRSNPMYWDKEDPSFIDKPLRGRVMATFAAEIGVTATDITR